MSTDILKTYRFMMPIDILNTYRFIMSIDILRSYRFMTSIDNLKTYRLMMSIDILNAYRFMMSIDMVRVNQLFVPRSAHPLQVAQRLHDNLKCAFLADKVQLRFGGCQLNVLVSQSQLI